jgi:membrane-bound lytic murein transglycosylase D
MPTARGWLLMLWAITVTGCGSIARVPDHQDPALDTVVSVPEVAPTFSCSEPVPTNVWAVLRNGFALDHETQEPAVARALDIYLANTPVIPDIESQARRYFAYVVDEVRARQMPMEIALLPIIESTLNPYAFSPSGASGLWQLIPSTAKQYGVTIDWWYDGRRDPVDSTAAALDYLTYLHDEFGDWLLAIAAYNGGEGRVKRALARSPRADFFDLDLPQETKRYVPKLLALAHLIADENTQALPEIDPAPAFFSAPLDDQVDLAILANLGAPPLEEMFRFNPGLNRRATPPDGPSRLLIPSSYRDAFQNALDQYPKDRVLWKRHKVKRGDTLGSIAKRYRTTPAAIRSTNGLNNNLIHPNQSLLIAIALVQPAALPANPILAASQKSSTRRLTYTVRRGDSLARIAHRFNVTVSAIADWNDVDPTEVLRPGQRLVLHISAKHALS